MAPLHLARFSVFSLVVVACLLSASADSSNCNALISSIQELTQSLPCVRDVCPNAGGVSIPTDGSLITPAPATASIPINTNPTDNVQVGSTDNVQVGTYIPNWFVYNKRYMGIDNIKEFGKKASGDAVVDYNFWAASMTKHLPDLTHLYYAFVDLTDDCIVSDADPDASWYGVSDDIPNWITIPSGACKGLMNDMMGVKAQFPHLKLMISIGGWTYSENFSRCAKTPEGRRRIYSTFDFFVKQMDPNWGKSSGAVWDGADFDWEFPETADGLSQAKESFSSDDWKNYVALITEFRAFAKQDGRDGVHLTSAIGVGNSMNLLVKKPDVAAAFCANLDFVNLMQYDLWGKWDSTTGHNAPFCDDENPSAKPAPGSGRSVQGTFAQMASVCPSHKLAMGLPNYSPGWTDVPDVNNGLYQTAVGYPQRDPEDGESNRWAAWSTFSGADDLLLPQGILTFWDLKKTLANPAYEFQLYQRECPADNGIVVPVKWMYSAKEKAFACYDDEDVTEKKARWARGKKMGGFFFWDAQQDKNGDLLQAARKGWGGLPSHVATGTHQCFDNRKPNYNKDPLTNQEYVCRSSGLEVSLRKNQGCGAARTDATAMCISNGKKKAVAVGGSRPGETKCRFTCTRTWGNGPLIWENDKVVFDCV